MSITKCPLEVLIIGLLLLREYRQLKGILMLERLLYLKIEIEDEFNIFDISLKKHNHFQRINI
jgi:hypothetical protein